VVNNASAALPAFVQQVLDDNIWEQRIAQREALQEGTGEEEAAAAMDTDAPAAEPAASAEATAANEANGHHAEHPAGPAQRGRPRPTSSSGSELSERGGEGAEAGSGSGPRPALASSARAKGSAPKRVRFQGLPQPPQVWVPPHRREGYVPRWV
jgi:hypothetical protein